MPRFRTPFPGKKKFPFDDAEHAQFIDAKRPYYSFYSRSAKDWRWLYADEVEDDDPRLELLRRGMTLPKPEPEGPRFWLNEAGNIFYARTDDGSFPTGERNWELFEGAAVLLDAMTAAMRARNRSLFDYDAWVRLIRASGHFVELQDARWNLLIGSSAIAVDAQIVSQLLPGLSGASLEAGRKVLRAFRGEFQRDGVGEDTRLAHALLICEENAWRGQDVVFRLFYASKKSHAALMGSPRDQGTDRDLEQRQEAHTFRFIQPWTIAKLAEQRRDSPQAYEETIAGLTKSLEA